MGHGVEADMEYENAGEAPLTAFEVVPFVGIPRFCIPGRALWQTPGIELEQVWSSVGTGTSKRTSKCRRQWQCCLANLPGGLLN